MHSSPLPTIPVPFLADGSVIGGIRYRIKHLLGKGGFGEVYLAYDVCLRRDVAIKVSLHSLQEEALHLASIIHPGIPHVYDVWQEGPLWCMALQYIEGETLAQQIASLQRQELVIDTEEFLTIALALCNILIEVHSDNGRDPIIMCDVKPSNVILSSKRVYLIDFGVAHQMTLSSSPVSEVPPAGTPGYQAPEYWYDGCITPQTDIYALGMVFYQAVTGQLFRTCTCTHAPCTCGAFTLERLGGPLGSMIMTMVDPVFEKRSVSLAEIRGRLRRMLNRLRWFARRGAIGQVLVSWYTRSLVF